MAKMSTVACYTAMAACFGFALFLLYNVIMVILIVGSAMIEDEIDRAVFQEKEAAVHSGTMVHRGIPYKVEKVENGLNRN